MPATHPYVSNPRRVIEIVNYLRKEKFPTKFSANTLEKAKIPTSYTGRITNALQFIEVIDKNGRHNKEIEKLFSPEENDKKFTEGLANLIKKAYSPLFEKYKHEEDTWNLTEDELTAFFKAADGRSVVIAERQAPTFLAFAELADKRQQSITDKSESQLPAENTAEVSNGNFGLAVKIEVNLPAGGTKEDYDKIFKSIKENLVNE